MYPAGAGFNKRPVAAAVATAAPPAAEGMIQLLLMLTHACR